jgi:hypothetical protein
LKITIVDAGHKEDCLFVFVVEKGEIGIDGAILPPGTRPGGPTGGPTGGPVGGVLGLLFPPFGYIVVCPQYLQSVSYVHVSLLPILFTPWHSCGHEYIFFPLGCGKIRQLPVIAVAGLHPLRHDFEKDSKVFFFLLCVRIYNVPEAIKISNTSVKMQRSIYYYGILFFVNIL